MTDCGICLLPLCITEGQIIKLILASNYKSDTTVLLTARPAFGEYGLRQNVLLWVFSVYFTVKPGKFIFLFESMDKVCN